MEIAAEISDPLPVLPLLAAGTSPKTRVRGLDLGAQARVGGGEARRPGPHWAFRDEAGGTAAAISKFENWNRFYDPSVGRYLSPDSILMYPDEVIGGAMNGRVAAAYSYASNNPVIRSDPDGRKDILPLVNLGNEDPRTVLGQIAEMIKKVFAPIPTVSAGVSAQVSIVQPLTSNGGGEAALNAQVFAGGQTAQANGGHAGLFGVIPGPETSHGVAVSASVAANVAIGQGPWVGDFREAGAGLGPFGVAVFWSPGKASIFSPDNPGWVGISASFGPGAPAALYSTTTTYVPLK